MFDQQYCCISSNLKMLQYFNWLHNISVHIISWKIKPNMIQLCVRTCHVVRNVHLQKQVVVIRITRLLHLSCIKDAKNISCSPKAFSAETSTTGKALALWDWCSASVVVISTSSISVYLGKLNQNVLQIESQPLP